MSKKLVVSNFVGNESTVSVNTNAPHYRQLEESMPKEYGREGVALCRDKQYAEEHPYMAALNTIVTNVINFIIYLLITSPFMYIICWAFIKA